MNDGQKSQSSAVKKNFKQLIYRQSHGQGAEISVLLDSKSIWLSRKSLADLFGCSVDNIAFHLKNIFKIGELDEKSVTEKISATAADGKKYQTYFYNLDAIISVGYRINSKRATEFRIWATKILKNYLTHGTMANKKRMQCDIEYTRLIERAEKLRITEQELRKQIVKIAHEYDAAHKNANQISDEFREVFNDGINYDKLIKKSMNEDWWDKLGTAMKEFFKHLDNLTNSGTELYDYIETLVNETSFRPLISDFVDSTNKAIASSNRQFKKLAKKN